VDAESLDEESALPAGRDAPRRRLGRSVPPEAVASVLPDDDVAAEVLGELEALGELEVLGELVVLGELGRWCVSMAATRSPLRIPEAPEIPSWPASDLSSGSSIAESPAPLLRRDREDSALSGAVVVSVTDDPFEGEERSTCRNRRASLDQVLQG